MANDHTPEHGAYGSFDVAKTFATFAAAADLRAQTGFPTHCPQRLFVIVATGGTLVFKDRAGNTNTWTVPVGVFEVPIACSTLEISTMVGSVTAMWDVDASTRNN